MKPKAKPKPASKPKAPEEGKKAAQKEEKRKRSPAASGSRYDLEVVLLAKLHYFCLVAIQATMKKEAPIRRR
jgi:hypothetical protein